MEPTGGTAPHEPIAHILDEASRLPASRILALSRAYPRDPEERQAQAVRQAAASSRALSLGRFGVLTEAEFAVQDAVLAILLADRLGPDQVALLSRPWLDAR